MIQKTSKSLYVIKNYNIRGLDKQINLNTNRKKKVINNHITNKNQNIIHPKNQHNL